MSRASRKIEEALLPLGRRARCAKHEWSRHGLGERCDLCGAVWAPVRLRSTVYVVACDATGLTKIGFSENLALRLESIKTAIGCDVRLLAKMDGTKGLEQALHERFDHVRRHGEWFSLTEKDRAELVAAVESGEPQRLGVVRPGNVSRRREYLSG